MEKLILLDTSILIDYFRKTNKKNSEWISLIQRDFNFAVSVITKYEILSGVNRKQKSFWNNVFENILILPLSEDCVDIASRVNEDLKKRRKQIALADLFIASTALSHKIPIATLNKKHFERIAGLNIME